MKYGENMQADDVQSRQAGFVRYCLSYIKAPASGLSAGLQGLFCYVMMRKSGVGILKK